MHTVLRYLGGAALVAALIVGGVVVRIEQIGGADERTSADAIVAFQGLVMSRNDGETHARLRRVGHRAGSVRG